MKKSRWDRDLVVLLISTLITAITWVGFETYRAFVRTDIPSGVEKHLQEFDTSLNTEVFGRLELRKP